MKHFIKFIVLNFILFSAFAEVTVGTYNIKTFDASPGLTNKRELVKILKGLNFDFLTVQEIVNVGSFKKLIKKDFPDFRVVATTCGGAGRQQIAFVYNIKKFILESFLEDNRVSNPLFPNSIIKCHSLRPALVGTFKDITTNEKFVMLGVHLKAGGRESSYAKRKKQYKQLKQIVDEFRIKKIENIILMGDFNTTGFNLRDSDYQNFNNLLTQTNMVTTSEQIACSSYWSGLNRRDNIEESSILDHIVVPAKFLGMTKSSTKVGSHCAQAACSNVSANELGTSYKEVSDHCPIVTTFY